MDLLKFSDWNLLLNDLNVNQLFKTSITNETAQLLLGGPVLVAKQILEHSPDLLDKDSLNICMPGAAHLDAGNQGDTYGLLPFLLNKPNMIIHIDFVGPECLDFKFNPKCALKSKNDNLTVNHFTSSFEEYLKSKDSIDVLIWSSPGLEENAESWFIQDNGIVAALSKSIPILGCSYADDEAELDALFARAYGYKIDSIKDNKLKVILDEELTGGACNWAGQTWRLHPGTGTSDSELLELCNKVSNIAMEMCKSTGVAPFDFKGVNQAFYGTNDGRKYNWVDHDVLYLPEEYCLVNYDGELLVEDIEMDVDYLAKNRENFTQARFVAAILQRDYKEEYSAMFSDYEEEQTEMSLSDFPEDGIRMLRHVNPQLVYETLSELTQWDINEKPENTSNKILESQFSITSMGNYYPVYICGATSCADDYMDGDDPDLALLTLIDKIKSQNESFILLVSQGCLYETEDEGNHLLLGSIHKGEKSAFLFLNNDEPSAQLDRLDTDYEFNLSETTQGDLKSLKQYFNEIATDISNSFSKTLELNGISN